GCPRRPRSASQGASTWLRLAGRRAELRDPATGRGVLDDRLQPALTSRLLLRAHHPARGQPAVSGRLRLEKPERVGGRLEPLRVRGRKSRRLALVQVDGGPLLVPKRKRAQPGRISPICSSSLARRVLIALQMLVGFLGVKRMTYRCASIDRRTPSIHPKQSAWSTDSGQVTLGLPDPFLK